LLNQTKRKRFFFAKKKQKTSPLGAQSFAAAHTKWEKFFGSFFKKELLPFTVADPSLPVLKL
jgi:hypothetical protein